MNKELILSSTRYETIAAMLEDDLVAEIVIERERQRGVVGNIYKGRVSKVLPGSSPLCRHRIRTGCVPIRFGCHRYGRGVRTARVW